MFLTASVVFLCGAGYTEKVNNSRATTNNDSPQPGGSTREENVDFKFLVRTNEKKKMTRSRARKPPLNQKRMRLNFKLDDWNQATCNDSSAGVL